jgi:uncharacterized SAM-dependent methyltransferase
MRCDRNHRDWQIVNAWKEAFRRRRMFLKKRRSIYLQHIRRGNTDHGAVDFGKSRKAYLTIAECGAAQRQCGIQQLGRCVGLPFNFDYDSDFTS